MLELRKATLESQGYCVKLASSGYTAIKTLEETSVAAVLLEYKQGFSTSHRFVFLVLDLASYSSHNTRHLKYLYKKDQFKVCQFRNGPSDSPPATARNREFPKRYSLLFTEQSRESDDGQERIATEMRKQPVTAAINDPALQ
jgi:hypothetical protein